MYYTKIIILPWQQFNILSVCSRAHAWLLYLNTFLLSLGEIKLNEMALSIKETKVAFSEVFSHIYLNIVQQCFLKYLLM